MFNCVSFLFNCVSFFFFTRGDFNFDWLFFIRLIWWNKTRSIFSKCDQTNKNASNFALYIIKFIWFNKFDQINVTVYQWHSRVSFGFGDNFLRVNCPGTRLPVRVRIWVRISFGVGRHFSSGAIVLEPS